MQLLRLLFLPLLLAPMWVTAQQSSSSSSSAPPVVPMEPSVIVEDRDFRLRGFDEGINASAVVDRKYNDAFTVYLLKRNVFRETCRDDYRRSNKATPFKTTLRCYGTELGNLKDFMGTQGEVLQGTAGLTAASRAQSIARAELLRDAVDTVLFAIQSNVYSTKEGLLEAKHNLYKKYQLTLWDAWAIVRADHALTWSAHIIAKIDTLRIQEATQKLDRAALSTARECFVSQEKILRQLIQPTVADRSIKLTTELIALQECSRMIQVIPRALTASGTLLTPQP